VLGDQLDARAAALRDLDPSRDAVWMAEVDAEASYVWSHKLRIAAFLSAMRHFRDELRAKRVTVHYTELSDRLARDRGPDLASVLRRDLAALRPEGLRMTLPGDHRVLRALERQAAESGFALEVREDDHFYCGRGEFDAWVRGRKQLVLESFYRRMRRRHGVLLRPDGRPEGGRWNFDADNRRAFGASGPGAVPRPRRFRPDALTREVIRRVAQRFSDHPGSLEHFDVPVTRREARAALRDFVRTRLPRFGPFQDAMWSDEPFLYHSRLSLPLNLKLLDPRECVAAAVEAWRSGAAPLPSVEGFVRQVLGWREFVRGVYWRFMPEYARRNALRCADRDVPACFWDGETDMRCVRQAMRAVLDHGYAHHIQRLMVLGLLAQLLGVHPARFHAWHMAMYLDAIDWVSLPNALGMSQYGDGGIVGTKPYCASGAYVERMSDSCTECRFSPRQAVGERACPFTTLYWDFLARHAKRLRGNRRMGLQLAGLRRKGRSELTAIRREARALRRRAFAGERL
jgi:deoxyribodipyrimidine photolyase-related protein